MTLSMSDLSVQPPHGDLYWQENYPAITEDDATLWDIVEKAELPVLLASLAIALDDFSLLREEVSPPRPPLGGAVERHGGVGGEAAGGGQRVGVGGWDESRRGR